MKEKMKNYKIQQYLYNKTKNFDDLIDENSFIIRDMNDQETIQYILDYFRKDIECVFPAKSFAVAIIYSYLIEKYFAEPFYINLNDENLFCGNDKYFKPYMLKKNVYDEVLKSISDIKALIEEPITDNVRMTISYFCEEFSIKT